MDRFDHDFGMVDAPPRGSGIEVQVLGPDNQVRTFISAYNGLGAVAEKGQPGMLSYHQTYGAQMIAPATTGSEVYVRTGVPRRLLQTNELGWWQTGGPIDDALVDGTADVAVGNSLEILNAGTAFIYAGAARVLSSAAVACEARATNSAGLVKVYLIPEQHSIEAA